MTKFWKLRNQDKKILIALIVITIIYCLPIIIANRYYNDDLARSLYGYTGWNGDGRPLTELLLKFISGCSGKAIDVAPLPLILSVLILGYSLVLYGRERLSSLDNIGCVIALFSFIVNPFLIFNLSYKYDVISMILPIAIVFVLFSDFGKCKWWLSLLVSALCGIAVMGLYQPVIGLGMSMMLLEITYCIINNRKLKSLLDKLLVTAGLLIGAVIYKLAVAPMFITEESGDWRYAASQTITINGFGAIKQVLINLYNMFLYVYRFYKNNMSMFFKITIVVLFVSAHAYMLYRVIKLKPFKDQSKILCVFAIIVYAFMPLIIMAAGFSPLMLLDGFTVSGRMYITFGAVLLFLGIEIGYLIKQIPYATITIAIIGFVYSFSYIYMYGNAMQCQQEYEKYLSYNMANVIEEISSENVVDTLSIVGKTPFAPECAMMVKEYPALDEMVPRYINNSWWLGGSWLKRYLATDMAYVEPSTDEINNLDTIIPDYANSIYSIYRVDNHIYIKYDYCE